MAANLHIAITPETLFTIGGFEVTNTLFTSYLVTIALTIFLLSVRSKIKPTTRPKGIQNILEAIVGGLYSFFQSITHSTKKTQAFTPVIAGFFIFIMLNNWVELLPGFHTILYTGHAEIKLSQIPSVPWQNVAPALAVTNIDEDEVNSDLLANEEISHSNQDSVETESAEEKHGGVPIFRGANADINMTVALALISVGAIQYYGLKFAGKGYLKKYLNFSSPIMFFVGILEFVSELSKILSFAFRLFGNIFAGEVLIAVITFLIPVILPIPFIGLEIFVGFIQALVFAMLSLVFFTMSTETHH